MEMIRVRDFKLVFEQGKHVGARNFFDRNCIYNHCELIANDGFGWIIVRSDNGYLKIFTLPLPIEADPIKILEQQRTVTAISVKRFKKSGLRVVYLGPWTCVEVCKAMIGLSCWWITTPDMLLDYCVARNEGVSLSRAYVAKSVARSSIMYLSAPFVSMFTIISNKLRG